MNEDSRKMLLYQSTEQANVYKYRYLNINDTQQIILLHNNSL